jgi:phage protein U
MQHAGAGGADLMFAALGIIQFQVVGSPSAMRTSRGWSYAEQKVVEDFPRLQWVGDELEEIELDLKFHAQFANPAASRDAIYAVADSHLAQSLVFGLGRFAGMFVITKAEETAVLMTDMGDPIAIDMHLTLRRWVAGAEADPFAAAAAATPPIGITPAPAGSSSSVLASANPGSSALLVAAPPAAPPVGATPDSVLTTTIVRAG